MKKTHLAIIATAVLLAGCTMPWTKAPATTETEVVTDETATDGTTAGTTVQAEDTKPTEPAKPVDTTPSDTPKAIVEGGVYLPYTSTAVAQANGNIVLFFHANWCPTCVANEKDIKANLKDIPKSLTLLKVNYDDATALKELYGITAQHTFVQVDNSGKLIKKWRGGVTLKEIVAQVGGETEIDMPADAAKPTDTATNPF